MAFNGSGVYVLPVTTVTPAVSSTTISSSDFNTFTADLATALSLCLTEDGQNVATANLPMATYRHTGVGDGAALTDYASANQVVDGALTYGGASAAGTDTYAVTLTINPVAYAAGNRFTFIADVANTGACTLNVNAIGAKSIKMQDGAALPDNYIIANAIVDVEYDGTNMVLMGVPSVGVNTASVQTLTNKIIDGASNTISAGVLSTPQATTSGTTKTFSSIPSWVKKITVMFSGVSTNGTSDLLVRIGDSGGVEATGYTAGMYGTVIPSTIKHATGFGVADMTATGSTIYGSAILTLLDATNFIWALQGVTYDSVSTGYMNMSGGTNTLDSALTDVQITTVLGTDTFDAGSVNILYE